MVVQAIRILYCPGRMKRVYLDVCCLNRPFDDQTQKRVHLESEAVLAVLGAVGRDEHELVSSEALQVEIEKNPDGERRRKVRDILRLAKYDIRVGDKETARSKELVEYGFGAYDSLHIACAESAGADVLLTTDDRFLKKARGCKAVEVSVRNLLQWVAREQL